MALPKITRAIGFRDDMLVTSTWSQSGGSGTFTTDGDIGTLTSTSGGTVTLTQTTPALDTSTYQILMVRANPNNVSSNVTVTYTDSSTNQFNLPQLGIGPFGYTVNVFSPLATGKTLLNVKINQSGNTNFVLVDFILIFKELLTLPTAIRPLQEQDVSIMPVIPILGRQGGVTQYLGSMSPRYIVAGGLVNTTSGQNGWANTYTADQWWQLLKGIWIEQNTVQADGNPTWQWLTSDNINGKVLLSYAPQQVPGRIAYHDYALSLTEFNVNGLTTSNLPGITY